MIKNRYSSYNVKVNGESASADVNSEEFFETLKARPHRA
jgi:hypothetical protein